MEQMVRTIAARTRPAPGAVLELPKPITWSAPMWAFGRGVVSSGAPVGGRWSAVLTGVALAGPPVCATSQAADRGTGAGHGGERAAARCLGRPAAGRADDQRPDAGREVPRVVRDRPAPARRPSRPCCRAVLEAPCPGFPTARTTSAACARYEGMPFGRARKVES